VQLLPRGKVQGARADGGGPCPGRMPGEFGGGAQADPVTGPNRPPFSGTDSLTIYVSAIEAGLPTGRDLGPVPNLINHFAVLNDHRQGRVEAGVHIAPLARG